jgi:hypothetical protein
MFGLQAGRKKQRLMQCIESFFDIKGTSIYLISSLDQLNLTLQQVRCYFEDSNNIISPD